jgi:uncharacterized iron-regulated protein
LVLSVILLAASYRGTKQNNHLNLYDLQARQSMVGSQAVDALKKTRLVLVGEHHTHAEHHAAQLQIIRALNEKTFH